MLTRVLQNRWLFGLLKPIPAQANAGIDDLLEGNVGGALERIRKGAFIIAAVGFCIYHLYAGFLGAPPAWSFRSTHLSWALVLCFLSVPTSAQNPSSGWLRNVYEGYTLACLALAVIAAIMLQREYPGILMRQGIPNLTDKIMFPMLVFLVLEASRRTLGYAITIVGGVFLFYSYFGDWFPGLLQHPGFSHNRVTSIMYIETEGLFSIPIAVTAAYVALFLIFAAFLVRSSAGEFFTDLAFSLTGRYTGGPAKAAIWSSCAMASMSGSPVANVVSTGSITIPLMTRVGYRPQVAAAIEAVASTGGALMPPVMGAAAFIMAEYTMTPYVDIIFYALWPALLYYIGVTLIVHFEARRQGLRPPSRETLPKIGEVLYTRGHLLVPLIILILFIVQGYTVAHAVSYAIAAMAALVMFRATTRMNLRDLVGTFELAARMAVPTVVACAAAGIVVGTVTLTGLGIKLTGLITSAAGGTLFVALIFTMIISLIMGMGMTTTSVYVVVAVLCVPSMVELGADLISAHLFVIYFGMLSNVTPPIALAAYAGAAIAGANPFRTSVEAFRIALPAFLLPYAFIYFPQLTLRGGWLSSLVAVAGSLFVIIALSWILALIPAKQLRPKQSG